MHICRFEAGESLTEALIDLVIAGPMGATKAYVGCDTGIPPGSPGDLVVLAL